MSEGMSSGADAARPWEDVDPRLNVFALANGMDLSKGEGFRRLEWFSEGRERGIFIECGEDSTFRVSVLSWESGSTDERHQSTLGSGLSARDLSVALAGAIDAANAL